MFGDGSLTFQEFIMREPLPLATIHDAVLEFLRGRDDAAATTPSSLERRQSTPSAGIIMSRSDPEQRSSGWFVGCNQAGHDHNNPKNLKSDSLYQIVRKCPMALPYLALPSETLVHQELDASPRIYYQETKLGIKEGSCLDAKYGRRR